MLKIFFSERLILDENDFFSVGELENSGSVTGLGRLGLFWNKPITGDSPESAACRIEEEEIPLLTAETQITADRIRITACDAGAEVYTLITESGESQELEGRRGEIELIPGKNEYAVTLLAVNSRGNQISAILNFTLPLAGLEFRVVKDLFPLRCFRQSEHLCFGARITAVGSERPLYREEVFRIICRVTRLIRNETGKGEIPIDGEYGSGILVPLTALGSTISCSDRWQRDQIGGNFEYIPAETIGEITKQQGIYNIIFQIELRNNSKLVFVYSVIAVFPQSYE